MTPRTLKVEVSKIEGRCPVFREGVRFFIERGFILKNDTPLCMHALAALMPFYGALSRGIEPRELGLNESPGERTAYVQCPDPCGPTGGGTVIFSLEAE